jgi:hypothetical protein
MSEIAVRRASSELESERVYGIDEMLKMAGVIANAGMFRMNANQAASLMFLAQSLRIHPMQGLMRFHITQDGRPTMRADAMLAGFLASGGTIKYIQRTDQSVIVHGAHPASGELRVCWDKSRAEAAGLWAKPRTPWVTNPCQMLSARCVAELVRALNPGVAIGMYVPEEFNEMALEEAPVNQGETSVPPLLTAGPVSQASNSQAAAAASEITGAAAVRPAPAARTTDSPGVYDASSIRPSGSPRPAPVEAQVVPSPVDPVPAAAIAGFVRSSAPDLSADSTSLKGAMGRYFKLADYLAHMVRDVAGKADQTLTFDLYERQTGRKFHDASIADFDTAARELAAWTESNPPVIDPFAEGN